ncbi:NAD-dependent epimerase/dehydratase family protein [Undibacterium umbellatum]|uniref:NAD(P)-dependent oxidoreductase n=1 Tax=Undibacterium umbellatum TaxID=2762300 RepID=A0ABR6Z9U0_9BURK|nr:NAD(P)-dependent oxidoreductase [Undibacterium umbellatum]MBC3908525.1 NAD(P)-dependent oxidoreductase [Undibacterium umbellatum]
MKILITGGTGFLGRHLVWQLARDGHEVLFTGRNADVARSIVLAAEKPVEFVPLEHGSKHAGVQLQACSTGADVLVHSAALTSPWGSQFAFQNANVASTSEVLAACHANAIPCLINISSPSIYFNFCDQLGIREDIALPSGVNEYARSKQEAERLVMAAAIPLRVILRPRAIFGPWDNALLPRLLRLLRYGRLPLLRGGRALLDMTYVDNVVHAVKLSIKLAPSNGTEVFNISNGEPIAAADLFAKMAEQFGIPLQTVNRPYFVADLFARLLECAAKFRPQWEPPFTRYSLATLAYSQTLDLSRAREVLGYSPIVTLDEGIDRTAQWWKQQGLQA